MIAWDLVIRAVSTFAVLCLVLPGCKNGHKLEPASQPGPRSTVVVDTGAAKRTFRVELALSPEEHSRGLMYRQQLALDAGMLFVFERPRVQSFWMQNTFIPLDMVFIGADGLVKHIHAKAKPMDTTSIPSRYPVRFVLEIQGGRAAEIGLKEGDRIEHVRVGTPPA